MTEESSNDLESSIKRNLAGIQQQRSRLRETGDAIAEIQMAPVPAPPATTSGDAATPAKGGDIAKANARMIRRVIGVLDRLGDAVVTDISNAEHRTALLHAVAAQSGQQRRQAEPPRARTEAIDIDFVNVEPGKTPDAS